MKILADFKEKPVEWLWEGRIPLGEITVVEGHPGNNKSSFLCDLAARLSKGRSMPCLPPKRGRNRKGGAIFLIGEDSVEKTVKKRLVAAGADPDRIGVFEDVLIPSDLLEIEKAVHEIGAKLIVVDTLTDFVTANLLNNQSVRKALRPLRELAARTNVAVVVIRHLNKSKGSYSLLQGGGSVAITAVARSQLKLYKHPEDDHLRVLVQDKSIQALPPNLLIEVTSADNDSLKLEWLGETDLTVADLEKSSRGSPKLKAAEDFLFKKLADGPKKVNWLVEESKGQCSERTLHEAKKNLEVKTIRKGKGKNHKVFWQLPTPCKNGDCKELDE